MGEKWLDECPSSFKPILYRRYVDDSLIVFRERSHAPQFLKYLNDQHRNIKFTIEHEEEGKLPFLDLILSRFEDKLLISIFRKPTFSGLGTSFFSYCSYKFKINSIKTLLHRAYQLTSNFNLFHEEIVFLRSYFINNGYTCAIFNKHVKSFLNNIYHPKLPILTVPKEEVYFKIPFLGKVSDKIESILTNKLSTFYPQVKFRFIQVNDFKIRSFFCFKDRLPDTLRSSIIYKFTCPSCHTGYIGSTLRAFKVRIDEHMGHSSRTGLPFSSPPHSAVRDHCYNCNISVSPHNFAIVDSCNPANLRILESLHIHKDKPSLNNYQSAVPLHMFD